MIQKTRALQRASAAASARAAVTARRPKLIFGTAAAAVLGIALTTGIVSAPAVGAEKPDAAASVARLFTGAEPIARLADGAALTLAQAQDALGAAEAMNEEVLASGLPVVAERTSVDTDDLARDVSELEDRALMPTMLLTALSARAERETEAVQQETATLRAALTAAQEKKAADDAAAAAAAQAAEAAAALAAANTVDGAKATARQLAASRYGWGDDQFSCLNSLWTKESSWNYQAYNPSGATGIPQALPGSKMASAGADWQTNAATQIAWGLGYISSVYGTPCSAWSHSQATNWY
ncbi:phospholipase [Microbacterium sp. XT11]|uniref:aggregation-promoting factor C-terminal-like domain-containing protein n=1 Tax=Microbacterium sp. XT11 TaxID=367477 RepID=UPI0007431123|nr:phospholipase [Microbacterium sp. XT11]ALX66648.1 hypothetical protein AB663_001950 [Microbacterium sp. XT11]